MTSQTGPRCGSAGAASFNTLTDPQPWIFPAMISPKGEQVAPLSSISCSCHREAKPVAPGVRLSRNILTPRLSPSDAICILNRRWSRALKPPAYITLCASCGPADDANRLYRWRRRLPATASHWFANATCHDLRRLSDSSWSIFFYALAGIVEPPCHFLILFGRSESHLACKLLALVVCPYALARKTLRYLIAGSAK